MLMRAPTVSSFGEPESVDIVETPLPAPGPGQVRVKVGAGALNPVDAAMRSGVFGCTQERIGLGRDVAGTVDALGAGAEWTLGIRVMGLATGHCKPLGTHADYVVFDASAVAPASASLDDAAAERVAGRLGPGHPGDASRPGPAGNQDAGAAGGHAVARATADWRSPRWHRSGTGSSCRAGVPGTFCHAARSLPPPLPTVCRMPPGRDTGQLAAIRDRGAYVGLWPGQEPALERGIRVAALDVRADGEQLAELSRLADHGVLLARVEKVFPLDDASAARTRLPLGLRPATGTGKTGFG